VAAVAADQVKEIKIPEVVLAALESLSFVGHKINTKRLHSCQ
jgi:hypothetical protein